WRPRASSFRASTPGQVLVIGDRDALGHRVVSSLAMRGAVCTGAANPAEFASLAQFGAKFDCIIDLRAYDVSGADAGLSMLSLARGLQAFGEKLGSPRLIVVTAGAQAASAADTIRLENAGLPGTLRTLPRELPWLHCRHVDLESGDVD